LDEGLSSLIERLPHRSPFRFLTRVVEHCAGNSGKGVWVVAGNEAFFAGHFPGRPVVPGVLIGEALAQLSGLVGFEAGASNVRLAHIDLKFVSSASPPTEITLQSSLVRKLGELCLFDVSATCGERLLASGQLMLARDERTGPTS